MSNDFNFTRNQKLLIEGLNSFNVEYLVIGGLAVKKYYPKRKTKDLDILLPCDLASALQVTEIFRGLKMAENTLRKWEEILLTPGIRLACPDSTVNEIDILTSIDGIDFRVCYQNSNAMKIGKLNFRVPSKSDLIKMKTISLQSGNSSEAHEKDRQDIYLLSA
jgi:hypothetical protein